VKRLTTSFRRALEPQAGEVSLVLVADREISRYNRRYLNRSGPTNVLAFSMQEGPYGEVNPQLWGDIVVSTETADREAREAGLPLVERVAALIVHGWLHLQGYDHERSPEEERLMELRTGEIVERMGNAQRRNASMTRARLAVNVDHVATLRQARRGSEPDPVLAAGLAELAGAEGIIVHLREDRRHIQDRDLRLLRETVQTKLNLEMGAAEEIIRIALKTKPDFVTLVPEKRQELTTEGGLEIVKQQKNLAQIVSRFHRARIEVSLFIDADPAQIRASRDVGADIVELHTGHYANARGEKDAVKLFERIREGAEQAAGLGLKVSAGHGLNYVNTKRFAGVGEIEEYSIGHSIMARAIYVGLDQAVREMIGLIEQL
jgi:pyridoxine 5-phosphate synthase